MELKDSEVRGKQVSLAFVSILSLVSHVFIMYMLFCVQYDHVDFLCDMLCRTPPAVLAAAVLLSSHCAAVDLVLFMDLSRSKILPLCCTALTGVA